MIAAAPLRGVQFISVPIAGLFLVGQTSMRAEEAAAAPPQPASWLHRLRPLFKQHTVVTSNDLSGPGGNVPGLAATYDMSLFEWSWGGRQATVNGAGITTNANFPLTEGEAISTNDSVGFSTELVKGVDAGVLWQLYAVGGDRTVGRVFGPGATLTSTPGSDRALAVPRGNRRRARPAGIPETPPARGARAGACSTRRACDASGAAAGPQRRTAPAARRGVGGGPSGPRRGTGGSACGRQARKRRGARRGRSA